MTVGIMYISSLLVICIIISIIVYKLKKSKQKREWLYTNDYYTCTDYNELLSGSLDNAADPPVDEEPEENESDRLIRLIKEDNKLWDDYYKKEKELAAKRIEIWDRSWNNKKKLKEILNITDIL